MELTTNVPSKVRNYAIAQHHQTICAVPSHSRALQTFKISCGIDIYIYIYIQARRQDLAAGGAKNQKGGPHFKTQYWTYVAAGSQT